MHMQEAGGRAGRQRECQADSLLSAETDTGSILQP